MQDDHVTPDPGTRSSRLLETGESYGGIRAGIPLVTLQGASEGPVITVLAAQHGRELNGIESIRRALRQIDPASLRGCAYFIPCANPIAVRMRQQDFPHERGRYISSAQSFNLNREWPGKADGTLYQRMTDVMWREAVSKSSLCIDLHGWTGLSASLVWGIPRDADWVRAFGLEIHSIRPDSPVEDAERTTLEKACRSRGIVNLTAELTPQKVVCEASIRAGTRGILNIMKRMGMLDGEPDLPPLQIELDDGTTPHREIAIQAEFSGVLVPRVQVPALVKAGEVFAELVDPDDVFHTQSIAAPIDGVVFNVGGIPWGEEMAESSVKDAGETVALVKTVSRCIHNA